MIVIGVKPAISSIQDVNGRQQEKAALTLAQDVSSGGHTRIAMLAGEPGIGKTRLAQKLSRYAVSKKAKVSWGRCTKTEGTPPYWPWVLILREYFRDNDPDNLRTEMGSCVPFIAEIVPELSVALTNLKSAPAIDESSSA